MTRDMTRDARRVLAVTYMEARDRAGALLVALAVGVLLAAVQVAGPLEAAIEESGQAALVLSLVTPLILALALGVSMPSRDASTRRLAFYLARPVSMGQFWAGRAIGIAILLGLSALLVAIPVLLCGAMLELPDHPAFAHVSFASILLAAAVTSLALFVMGYCLSAAFQSSPRWVPLALVGSACVGAGLIRSLRLLLDEGAIAEAARGLAAFVVAALVIGLVAGWLHVARGRVEARRGAAVFSLVLWSALGLATLLLFAYATSVIRLEPDEIVAGDVTASASGKVIRVQGAALEREGTAVALLVDVRSGDFVEVGRAVQDPSEWFAARHVGSGCLSSRFDVATDDSGFAWSCEAAGRGGTWMASIESWPPIVGEAPPTARWTADRLPFDGARSLAALQPESDATKPSAFYLESIDVATGTPRMSVAFPTRPMLLAADASGVLVATQEGRPRTRGATQVARVRPDGRLDVVALVDGLVATRFGVDLAHSRMLASAADGASVLLSLDDGREIGRFPPSRRGSAGPWLLSDGRVLREPEGTATFSSRQASPASDGPSLALHDPNGVFTRGFQLDRGPVFVGGELAPDRVIVAVPTGAGEWTCRLIDLRTGEAPRLPAGLIPLETETVPRARIVQPPGSDRARLFREGRRIVWFDALTSQRRVIAGRE